MTRPDLNRRGFITGLLALPVAIKAAIETVPTSPALPIIGHVHRYGPGNTLAGVTPDEVARRVAAATREAFYRIPR